MTRSDLVTVASFAAYVVLIASNIIAVSVTNQELPPFWAAATRFAAASSLFFLVGVWRRLRLPRGRALVGALLFGVLQFGLAFPLAYWGLVKVPPGLASVIFASVPLFTIFFATALRVESLRLRGVAGALVALAGIAVIFGERAGGDVPAASLLALVGAAAAFALAPVVVKIFPPVHPAPMNAVAMLVGMFILLTLSRLLGEPAVIPAQTDTWLAHLFLIGPGSLGLFALLLFLLERWPASTVSYQAVLSPIVAVALSWWLLGEPLTGGLILGGALVFGGVYVGALT